MVIFFNKRRKLCFSDIILIILKKSIFYYLSYNLSLRNCLIVVMCIQYGRHAK